VCSTLVYGLIAIVDFLLVHTIQDAKAELDITQQLITSALGEVLANHHSQHLQVLGLGSHGIGRHNPRALTELMSNGEFVVVLPLFLIKAESHKW